MKIVFFVGAITAFALWQIVPSDAQTSCGGARSDCQQQCTGRAGKSASYCAGVCGKRYDSCLKTGSWKLNSGRVLTGLSKQ